MIKDVLVHVDASPAGAKRLAYAFDLAATHEARLTGAHVVSPVDLPHYVSPYDVERMAQDRHRWAQENAVATEVMFRQVATERSTLSGWRLLEGDMSQRLSDLARCADLVIVGQYESVGPGERHPLYLAEEVVLAAGRPVLVVPGSMPDSYRLRRALIGWDGGREAARSVHDALPLLVRAKPAIEILSMEEGGRSVSPSELSAHLGRHGLEARVSEGQRLHTEHGAALVERLRAGEFDLLVIGAYGHPIWRTLLFGGATQSVLMHAPTPVFVSH